MQPGICFSCECNEELQSAIVRDVHDCILSTHNPRVIATIQQSGGCSSRAFNSMEYGFAPYLPDTVLDLQPFSSFAHYQELQPRPARIVMRQRQRDFAASKCCMQQWLWNDMDCDMRLRVAYLCMCVAELHAVSGSPDLFQLTPELIHVISTLPNVKPTFGFKCNSAASAAPSTINSHETANSQTPASAPAATASSAFSANSDDSNANNNAVHTSNKQRKKAMQKVDFCSVFPRAFWNRTSLRDVLCRRKWRRGRARTRTTKLQPTFWREVKSLSRSNSSTRRRRLQWNQLYLHMREAAALNRLASG
jgi:hypothetical protein